MTSNQSLLWIVFALLVAGLMSLDLGVFSKKAHAVKMREALLWSGGWILLAILFGAFVWYELGGHKAGEFFTGYVVEESLSVDNLFVFIVIFSYFKVPSAYHHRILFWGIIGAVIMRGLFIASGALLLERLHWIIYVFGAFLVVTGIKMLLFKEREIHPEKNVVVGLFKKLVPILDHYDGQNFFVLRDGRFFATTFFVVLLVVETTDVLFAVDSIPAIFAITQDPLIVYTSNIFAVLGLRSLYFALAGAMERFAYLKIGLSFVLCFVGVKMLISKVYKIPIFVALGVVVTILAVSVIASFIRSKAKPVC